jgi:hypothetical protein
VGHLDKALAVVGTDLSLTDLRLVLLDNRMLLLTGAVGRRDGRDRRRARRSLMHGVAALISVHRGDIESLEAHLDAGLKLPLVTAADQENCDFLLAAEAMAEWYRGNLPEAITVLGAILDTKHALMILRHQWLPDLVRMALDYGDVDTARAAVMACELEAAQETTPARAAAAARRCRCVLDGDPDGLRQVIDHYQGVGRTYELARTAEDFAMLLRRAGRATEAEAAHSRAVALYRELGAGWAVRRAASPG